MVKSYSKCAGGEMLNSKIVLIVIVVILCCTCATIATPTDEPSKTCPKNCDCDELNYYEATKCSRNGSSLELILLDRGNFDLVVVNCTTADQFVYEILPEFYFVALKEIIRYNGCPLPLSKSFSQIHPRMSGFEFNTTKRISIGREYFNGFRKLQQLHLRSSSTIHLTDDVITDLRHLKHLTIISNEINGKIFDHPSRVTDLTVGGVNDEFSAEALKKWTQLSWFTLTDSKIQHLSKEHMLNLPNIDSVTLSFNDITTFDSDTFESLHQLKTFSLENNKIANMPQRLIVKAEHINIRCVEGTGFDTLPDEFLSNLVQLRIVRIVGCNMTSVPETLLKKSTSVEELDLSNNLLTDLPENFLANQTLLYFIDLSSNRFGKSSDKFFENLLTKPIWSNERFSISFAKNGFKRLSREQISLLSQFRGDFYFQDNSITDLSGFDGLVKGHDGSFIDVERNPINCDCLSINSYKKYADSVGSNVRDAICATPLNLNGTSVIDVEC